ncbi:MAG: apolipoprotein N-acyltransferase [Pseudonocardia sp.]
MAEPATSADPRPHGRSGTGRGDATPARPSQHTRGGGLAFAARLAGAAGGGLLLYLSFPPRTLWWLALPAFALLGVVLHGRRARAGLGWGAVFATAFLLPLLVWTGSFVGALPWLALCALETVFVAAAAAGMAVVSRLPAAPLGMAAVWVAGEAARARVPFGGFPWGRAAFGQPDGPLLPVAALGGVPLLSFVTVLAGLALGELLRRLVSEWQQSHFHATTWRESGFAASGGAVVGPAVLLAAALLAGPVAALVPASGAAAGTGSGVSEITVAAVQGNVPRLGLDFNAQRRAVLDNHVRTTEQLAADVAAGHVPKPDLVIWPENASDIDPLRNPDAAAEIDAAARAVGVPVLLGTVLRNPDGRTAANATLVWEAGRGVTDRTDKRRVQPFGEYIPYRAFFRLFSDFADRAGYFVPGAGAGVVDMAGVTVGVVICWEVAFDDLVADSVAAGATLLAVPSNNATFGLSEMTYQQLAMSRVRAVEHDRAVVVATTSGVSAVVAPDGSVVARTGQFTPGSLVERVPLRSTTTLAASARSVPEWVLAGTGLVMIGLGFRRGA